MISPAALLALKSYTSLKDDLTGSMTRGKDGQQQLSAEVQRFDGTAPTSSSSICLRRALRHNGLADVTGTELDGPFFVEGQQHIEQPDGRRLQVALDKGGRPALISYVMGDILDCGKSAPPTFVTLSNARHLVPDMQALKLAKNSRVLIATTAGCFLAEGTLHADAEPLFRNLASAPLFVSLPHANTIYRVASNCLLAGPADYGEKLQDLQRSLGLPVSSKIELLDLKGDWGVCANVLDLAGAPVVAARMAALGLAPLQQRLDEWPLAPRKLHLHLRIGTPAQRAQTAWTAGDLPIVVDCEVPHFAPLLPGQTAVTQRDQFDRLLRGAVDAHLPHLGQKSFAQAVAQAINAQTGHAGIFAAHGPAEVRTRLASARGEPVDVNGSSAVVPDFAAQSSPRMAAFCAPLVGKGLHVKFYPWKTIRNGLNL